MSWSSLQFHYLALISLVGFGAASILELIIYQKKNTNGLKYLNSFCFILASLACLLIEVNLIVPHGGSRIGNPLAGFLIASLLSFGVI